MDLAKNRELNDIVKILIDPVSMSVKASSNMEKQGSGFLGAELVRAAMAGQVERVKELLMQGADVTYRDSDGFNAYERARDNRNQALTELLKSKN